MHFREQDLINNREFGMLLEYTTVIRKFSDNTQKILYHSFSKVKGKQCTVRKSGGVSTKEELERFDTINLIRVKQKVIDYAYENYIGKPWEWFVTLTFDPKEVDSKSYSESCDAMHKWLDNMKHQNRGMEYLIVPELHKSGRIHFHGLFKNVPKWKIVPAINPHTGKEIFKNGSQIFNLVNYKYGFTTLSEIKSQEAVTTYISKYISKDLLNIKYKRHYWCSKSLRLPEEYYYNYSSDELKDYIKDYDVKYEKEDIKENYITTIYELEEKHNLT